MAKRSKFNLSNYRLLTGEMGRMYPCQLQEVLPGDVIRASSSAMIRISPQLAPVMHPVTARIHHWFVPHRLSWKYGDPDGSFEDFITGGPDGDDTQTVPTVDAAPLKGQLHDYLGIPPITDGVLEVNALPVWAVSLIYDEWYRDQDLLDKRTPVGFSVPNICWEKDYLTSARPTPQKGPDITIPLAQELPVKTRNAPNITPSSSATDGDRNAYFGTPPDPDQALVVELDEATATNVNDWRRAFALQRYQEARSQYGSRYSEYLRYLGVQSSDARLQRPEYLGGGKATVNFSEVLQTADDSASEQDVNVGTLRGHGIAAVRTRPFTRYFTEHGYMISLISLRPKTIYQDGVPRTFLRKTKEDFWQRELQQIGQQPVYNNEVMATAQNQGDEIFGWQDRYSEYKRTMSGVSGDFRDTLDFWHMARQFDNMPALNGLFVQCDATKRIHADQTSNPLWMMVSNRTRARRLVRKGKANRIL